MVRKSFRWPRGLAPAPDETRHGRCPHVVDDAASAPLNTPEPDPAGGRDAVRPGQIPDAGWRQVLLRVWRRIVDEHLSITAAGAAFYALLATFPALTALFSVYGLLFTPAQISRQIAFLASELPREALELLVTLIRGLAQSDRSRLGLGAVGGALITVWGASLGVKALMQALNAVYGETEKRRFTVRVGQALVLTLGAISVFCVVSFVVIALPLAAQGLEWPPVLRRMAFYARWPAVGLMFWLSLLILYRYGPSRARPRWVWVSWGAFAATALWGAGSALLSWYVSSSGTVYRAYGSMGYVVILLAWFLLSAYAVLIGALVNAELERQTRRDTTVGEEKPLGRRGANAADTVGGTPAQ
ncbi:MAG TPA: YihY/virulence factor BrkB family protein [Caldimonas sp.]|nr:YihY/virulence factor BrkB family protein [Caldimonas sp.]HEX2541353.1 YihY/virulence factor BrkB family protein [Caldimonas sp.]